MTLRAVPAGISSPWQVQPCRISRGVEARQRTVPGPPGWGLGGGPITRPLKTKQITETLNVRRQPSLGANVIPCLDRQSMTPLGQSHGRTGLRYKSQRLTELVGGTVLRPYVPHGMKEIGEEGDLNTSTLSGFHEESNPRSQDVTGYRIPDLWI